jgi:hypothetical protein
MSFNGVWQPPVEAGTYGAFVFAELSDDCLLTFLDNEKPSPHPDNKDDASNEADPHACVLHIRLKAAPRATIARASTATVLWSKQAAKLPVEIAPQLIQIWGLPTDGPLVAATLTRLGKRRALFRPPSFVEFAIFATSPAGIIQIEHAPNTLGQRSPA